VRYGLGWLSEHGTTTDAGFVLRGLLERPDVRPDDAHTAIGYGLDWLGRYGVIVDAQFVLAPLLKRPDVPSGDVSTAMRYALGWLGEHGAHPSARFVLQPTLTRRDLSSADAAAARGARDVLARRTRAASGGRVRAHADAQGSEACPVRMPRRSFETRWSGLGVYGGSTDAGYVPAQPARMHRPVPRRRRCRGALCVALVRRARHEPAARFVLPPLLARKELTASEVEAATRHALNWLNEHATHPYAGFVLAPVLKRADVPAADAEAGPTQHALDWLNVHDTKLSAGFVLQPLLKRTAVASGRGGHSDSARDELESTCTRRTRRPGSSFNRCSSARTCPRRTPSRRHNARWNWLDEQGAAITRSSCSSHCCCAKI